MVGTSLTQGNTDGTDDGLFQPSQLPEPLINSQDVELVPGTFQTADEAGSSLAHAGDIGTSSSVSAEDAPARKVGILGFCRRRWRLVVLLSGLWLLICVTMYLTVPQAIINSRLQQAHVSLGDATMTIKADSGFSLTPHVRVIAPQELLQFPLVSFTATIHPFKATVYMDVPTHKKQGDTTMEGEVGVMTVSQEIEIDSSEDVFVDMGGDFEITGIDFLGGIINNFIRQPELSATIKAKVDVSGKAWGWLPVKLWNIAITYDLTVAAFNNFKTKQIQLDKILAADGVAEDQLNVKCSALVYNPSPMTMVIEPEVSLLVSYHFDGTDHNVGELKMGPNLKMAPAMNSMQASLMLARTPENAGAIVQMITAYMGGVQEGFAPSARTPFLVSVKDNGVNSSTSVLIQQALRGLVASVDFRPKPVVALNTVTSDVVAGTWLRYPPNLNLVRVHIQVHNPLPQTARVEHVKATFYYNNLDGDRLYEFDREAKDLDQSVINIPANADHWMHISLKPWSEVVYPSAFTNMGSMIHDGFSRKISVGMRGEFNLILDPHFKQLVNYTNTALYGYICWNFWDPDPKFCGSG